MLSVVTFLHSLCNRRAGVNAFAAVALGGSWSGGGRRISGFLALVRLRTVPRSRSPDIPPTRPEGYLAAAAWYPRLAEQFVADNPPAAHSHACHVHQARPRRRRHRHHLRRRADRRSCHPIDQRLHRRADRCGSRKRSARWLVTCQSARPPLRGSAVRSRLLGVADSLSISLAHGWET